MKRTREELESVEGAKSKIESLEDEIESLKKEKNEWKQEAEQAKNKEEASLFWKRYDTINEQITSNTKRLEILEQERLQETLQKKAKEEEKQDEGFFFSFLVLVWLSFVSKN